MARTSLACQLRNIFINSILTDIYIKKKIVEEVFLALVLTNQLQYLIIKVEAVNHTFEAIEIT